MRPLHRWFGLVSAVFMMIIAVTGLALQIDLWATGTPPPGAPHSESGAPPSPMAGSDVDVTAALSDALATLRETRPDFGYSSITISLRSGAPSIEFSKAGPGGARLVTTPAGALTEIAPPLPPQGLHGILQDIHAGYFAGLPGRILSCLMAIALLVFSITGLVMYTDMYRRRRKLGKRGVFWR